MTQLVEGGRPIARFRVLGFPVTIDISFLVVVALLGWAGSVSLFLVWLVLVPVAVLVHELGHAVVARTTGAAPVITLAGLGGLTSYVPPSRLTRARSVAISVAGPAVGIAIGLLVLAVSRAVPIDGPGLAPDVVRLVVFTTLGWGLLNLLPILPLDGGQVLRELLPGTPARREVRAAAVSVVTAVLAAFVAYRSGLFFGALLAAFFVVSNVMTIRAHRDETRGDVNLRLVRLLWAGVPQDARDLLDDPRAGEPVHPLVRAAVLASGSGADVQTAQAELEVAADRSPPVPQAADLLLLVHRVRADWPAARALVAGSRGAVVDPGNVLAVLAVAVRSGAVRAGAEVATAYLGAAAATAPPGHVLSVLAYDAARAWASVGEPDLGLSMFRRAVDLGLADLTAVDSDQELAPLRPLPGYDEARSTVRERALAGSDPAAPSGS